MNPLGGGGSGDEDKEWFKSSRGRGRGSWTALSTQSTEAHRLRRPHCSTESGSAAADETIKNSTLGSSNLNDLIKNSTLRVEASEFVPKALEYQQSSQLCVTKSSVQDRIQRARLLPDKFVSDPKQLQQQAVQGQHEEHNHDVIQVQHQKDKYKESHQDMGGNGDNLELGLMDTMQQLASGIHTLTISPGQYDYLGPSLINIIKPHMECTHNFQEIMMQLIQQSIEEGNFRYSGARLCTSLDNRMTASEQALFRSILSTLCKKRMEEYAATWQNRPDHKEEDQKCCHGLILFLAELVAQMEDIPAFELGKLLVQLITVVLKNPAPNSAKHICQVLKLAGQTLERDKLGSKKEMGNVMRALTASVTEKHADFNLQRMVHNVCELRNSNWGQGPTVPSPRSIEAAQSTKLQHVPDEPVMYGPDGNVLSAEESQFLQDITEDESEVDEQGGSASEYDLYENEEDDMIDAAYEEFLNYSKQT